jgi:hypothetical protein
VTPDQWSQLLTALVGLIAAAAAYLSRKAASTATEAKHAAENGVVERTALRERAEQAEQKLQAMQLQRDTFRDIVRFVKSDPRAAPVLAAYTDKRQVAVHDTALDALLAPPAPPALAPAPATDWRPWVAGVAALLAAVGAAVTLGRKIRP